MAGVGAYAAVVVTLLLVLAGCGGGDSSVHVGRFTLTPAGHGHCQEVLAALPHELAGRRARRTTGSTYAAAYGNPAIVLRCGVRHPKGYATAPCITRNGIGWSIPLHETDDLGTDVTMTLAHRQPAIQVVVPKEYRPNGPSEVMAGLDKVVRAHTRAYGRCS